MITPETSNENEYAPFSITYAIEAVDPMFPPTLESVSVTASDGVDYSADLTITIHDDTSFTVAGVLADVFNREMHYLDKNDQAGMVRRWKDLPVDFNTVYRYKGAVVNSIDLTVTAVTSQGDEVATIIVQNNYTVSNAYLVDYIAKGKY